MRNCPPELSGGAFVGKVFRPPPLKRTFRPSVSRMPCFHEHLYSKTRFEALSGDDGEDDSDDGVHDEFNTAEHAATEKAAAEQSAAEKSVAEHATAQRAAAKQKKA